MSLRGTFMVYDENIKKNVGISLVRPVSNPNIGEQQVNIYGLLGMGSSWSGGRKKCRFGLSRVTLNLYFVTRKGFSLM